MVGHQRLLQAADGKLGFKPRRLLFCRWVVVARRICPLLMEWLSSAPIYCSDLHAIF
jgi:hypothetical protein